MNKCHNLNMIYKSGIRGPVYNSKNTLIKVQAVFYALYMNFNLKLVNTCSVTYFNENFLDVH